MKGGETKLAPAEPIFLSLPKVIRENDDCEAIELILPRRKSNNAATRPDFLQKQKLFPLCDVYDLCTKATWISGFAIERLNCALMRIRSTKREDFFFNWELGSEQNEALKMGMYR